MAELSFRSAGVNTREIDLSGPTPTEPQGTPAVVIGTSVRGPAFVPITFASYPGFAGVFGATDGEKFGPLAVQQWMKNRDAGTYLKVLGAGDGKIRTNAGTNAGKVTYAGFVAGSQLPQANGIVGANSHAYGTLGGRSYFLGAFMSESAGSTVLSSAGMPASFTGADSTRAGLTITIEGTVGDVQTLTITDYLGNSVAYTADGTENLASDPPQFKRGGTVDQNANSLKACIESATYGHGQLYGSLTVDAAAAGGVIKVRQVGGGTRGNTACDASSVTNLSVEGTTDGTANQFDGGANGNAAAHPIIRGVLLAPDGVTLTLSSSVVSHNSASAITATAGVYASKPDSTTDSCGGALIGSVDINTSEFVMLLNGLKQTDSEGKNVLTASFDPAATNYFTNVFNTDPLKIESKGHYLYRHYDIYNAEAVVTASGLQGMSLTVNASNTALEEAAFILTGAAGRNAGSSTQPNYENFEDRFRTAFSPWIISQKFGGAAKNIFKIHCLDDGVYPNDKLKISIENIQKSINPNEKFGKFDLVLRKFGDDDRNIQALESYRGLSLDPESTRYIARVIGDMNTYYDFDQRPGSQKLVTAGKFPNASNYIRVEMATEVDDGEISQNVLPLGFRGPHHLVTSGTDSSGNRLLVSTSSITPSDVMYVSQSQWKDRAIEPPVPFRKNVAVGTGISKQSDGQLYWGVQFEPVDKLTEPNKNDSPILQKSPIESFTNYMPMFHTSYRNPWVGDNAGTADDGGIVLDSDIFNNNKFTLENVQVATNSSDVVDSKEWQAATYQRDGSLASSVTKADGTTQTGRFLDVSKDFGDLASKGYFKFSLFTQGGFDGINVFNEDKARLLDPAIKLEMGDTTNQGGTSGPTISAYRKAVDILKEKSDTDFQLLAIPGIRQTQVTDYTVEAIEDRFDAFYVMDIRQFDELNLEITGSSSGQPSVTYTVQNFKNRGLDSSFAGAFFPDVTVRDSTTKTNVTVPPSVAVLGAFGLNDRVAHPWFAPAGFARGALDASQVNVRTNRNNLDELYDAKINPLAEFPGQGGPTIWGQKTLLAKASALDRINVRRLLIEVRRQVRNIARKFIFEPNREKTLARFSGAVNPILNRIQQQQGLDRFMVQIDTSTTTQLDVDNNTVRGKIMLQPTRSLEFISLDFVVSNAGTEI